MIIVSGGLGCGVVCVCVGGGGGGGVCKRCSVSTQSISFKKYVFDCFCSSSAPTLPPPPPPLFLLLFLRVYTV